MLPRILAALFATGLMFAPIVSAERAKKKTAESTVMSADMNGDMKRAIAWERFKDEAAARQARREERHPSVQYGEANRSADRMDESQGTPVKDPGPAVRKQ